MLRPKTRVIGPHFVADRIRLASATSLTWPTLKRLLPARKASPNGYNVLQGHSRSLVAVDSKYATSLANNTKSNHILHRFQDIANYWSNFNFR